QLDRRIGGDVDFVEKLVLGRLVHLVDAAAGDVELPAVIDAAQPAFLVAAEEQRGAAVRAIFVQEPDPPLTVAKGDEVFAQEPHPYRRTLGLGDLAREQCRDPVAPHRVAHRAALPHPGDQLVFLARQHRQTAPPDAAPYSGGSAASASALRPATTARILPAPRESSGRKNANHPGSSPII